MKKIGDFQGQTVNLPKGNGIVREIIDGILLMGFRADLRSPSWCIYVSNNYGLCYIASVFMAC